MSIAQFLRILLVRRWIIFTTLITCVVVAVATAKSLPERYEAGARVVLDLTVPDPVTGQVVGAGNSRSYVRTQIEMIQDYRIASDVVDRLGWLQSPSVIAAWQAETGGVGDMRRWAAQRIVNSTAAGLVAGSNILEIRYQAPNPETARRIVALLREAYVDASLRFKTDAAGRTAEWYREQADRALRSLNAAETAKAKFELDNRIIVGPSNVDAETAQLMSLQNALFAARTSSGVQQIEATKQQNNSPVVDQLKIQLALLNDQMGIISEKLGPEHPNYKSMEYRRDLLNRQIALESQRARSAGAAQGETSTRTLAQLQADYDAQKEVVLRTKGKLNELAQLGREVEQRRKQYEMAAQRTANLRLQANLSETGLVVLGDPIVGSSPSFPNWPLVFAASAGFGLALGVVAAIFAEMLARRVRGMEDLAFAGKVPVLAIVAERRATPGLDRIRRLFLGRRKTSSDWQPAE
jgi:polysaccharide biosynthesis transport protein